MGCGPSRCHCESRSDRDAAIRCMNDEIALSSRHSRGSSQRQTTSVIASEARQSGSRQTRLLRGCAPRKDREGVSLRVPIQTGRGNPVAARRDCFVVPTRRCPPQREKEVEVALAIDKSRNYAMKEGRDPHHPSGVNDIDPVEDLYRVVTVHESIAYLYFGRSKPGQLRSLGKPSSG